MQYSPLAPSETIVTSLVHSQWLNNDFAKLCQRPVKLIRIKCEKSKVEFGTWKENNQEWNTTPSKRLGFFPLPPPPLAFLNFKGVLRTQAIWPLVSVWYFLLTIWSVFSSSFQTQPSWGANRETVRKHWCRTARHWVLFVLWVFCPPLILQSSYHRWAISFFLSLGSIYLLKFS